MGAWVHGCIMKLISIKNGIALLSQKLGYEVDRSEVLHYWRSHELDFYLFVDCAVIPLPLNSDDFYNDKILNDCMQMPLRAYQFKGYVCLIDLPCYDYLIEKMLFNKHITYDDKIIDMAYLDDINEFTHSSDIDKQNKFVYCFNPSDITPFGQDENTENLYKICEIDENGKDISFNFESLMLNIAQIEIIANNYSFKPKAYPSPLTTKEKTSYLKVINAILHKSNLQDKAKHSLYVELNTFAQTKNLAFVNKDTFAKIIDEIKENEDKLF